MLDTLALVLGYWLLGVFALMGLGLLLVTVVRWNTRRWHADVEAARRKWSERDQAGERDRRVTAQSDDAVPYAPRSQRVAESADDLSRPARPIGNRYSLEIAIEAPDDVETARGLLEKVR